MGITYTDKHGHVHVGPTTEQYQEQQRRELEGAGVTAPAPREQEDDEGMFQVERNVWVEVRPGVTQMLYRHGAKIPEAEAERLGLLRTKPARTKKAPPPENKAGK